MEPLLIFRRINHPMEVVFFDSDEKEVKKTISLDKFLKIMELEIITHQNEYSNSGKVNYAQCIMVNGLTFPIYISKDQYGKKYLKSGGPISDRLKDMLDMEYINRCFKRSK